MEIKTHICKYLISLKKIVRNFGKHSSFPKKSEFSGNYFTVQCNVWTSFYISLLNFVFHLLVAGEKGTVFALEELLATVTVPVVTP